MQKKNSHKPWRKQQTHQRSYIDIFAAFCMSGLNGMKLVTMIMATDNAKINWPVMLPVERRTALVLDPKIGERENAVASL